MAVRQLAIHMLYDEPKRDGWHDAYRASCTAASRRAGRGGFAISRANFCGRWKGPTGTTTRNFRRLGCWRSLSRRRSGRHRGSGANAIFTAGNNYYEPQEQTEILSSAVDALLCIQTEAVGIPAFESTVSREGDQAVEEGEGSSVEVSAERQYFNMVSAALLSVERVAAQRLSRRGSFDAAGVAAELEVLRQRIEEARTERQGEGTDDPDDNAGEGAPEFVDAEERAVLRLEELRPQLQMCVTRAKV